MEFMDIINHTMACYTALPLIVMTFNDWARHTAKYRCHCSPDSGVQGAWTYCPDEDNGYGYRCTECDMPYDTRKILQTFGPYEVTE